MPKTVSQSMRIQHRALLCCICLQPIPSQRAGLKGVIEEEEEEDEEKEEEEDNQQRHHHLSSCADTCFLKKIVLC